MGAVQAKVHQRQIQALSANINKFHAQLQESNHKLSIANQRAKQATVHNETLLQNLQATNNDLQKANQQNSNLWNTLQTTNKNLEQAKQSAQQIPALEQDLQRFSQDVEAQKKENDLVKEQLKRKKEELEKVFGELKFARQELRSLELQDPTAQSANVESKITEKICAQLLADASESLAAASGTNQDPNRHQVYGTLVHDFGYKRVYCANPTTLWTGTQMWEKQRAFRQDRAKLIGKAKETSEVVGWPGTISVVEMKDTQGKNIGFVVDGQHRLGAAYSMSVKNNMSSMLEEILVEVYPQISDRAAKALFTEINKVEPVTMIDLPKEDGGAGAKEKLIIDKACENLRNQFSTMFKPSRRCLAPHLNIDKLRSEIHDSDLLQRMRIDSDESLLEYLHSVNNKLAMLSDEDLKSRGGGKMSDAALRKARGNSFFLGLGFGWLSKE